MADQNFIDYVKICCRSGKGGAGSHHYFRDKMNSQGGPDGGDGGRGGRQPLSRGGVTTSLPKMASMVLKTTGPAEVARTSSWKFLLALWLRMLKLANKFVR